MKKQLFFVFLLTMLHAGWLPAQISTQRPDIIPVSPEAADVQKYTSYPVDYSTGIPNISIPLFEVKSGDIVVPITLTYHSSGLKPQEASGYAGTGWTLNAEPSVMRTIRGLPDDKYTAASNQNQSTNHAGLYYTRSRPTSVTGKEYIRKLADNEYDGESDVYSYTLNPGGGTFYMSSYNQRMVTFPRTHDNIEYGIQQSGMHWFKVTNADGLVYKFGKGSNARETTVTETVRWLCDTISSLRTDARVALSYESARPVTPPAGMGDSKMVETGVSPYYLNYFITSQGWTDRYQWSWDGSKINKEWINKTSSTGIGTGGSASHQINRSRLSKISFNGHQVLFNYTQLSAIETITQINVKDANGTLIRTIDFFITPYNRSTDLTKLDSIRISAPGCDSRTYRFSYYGQDMVPNRNTLAIDHWGFANGFYGDNIGGVPTIHVQLSFAEPGQTYITKLIKETIIGNNREPNAEYAKHGVLNQIDHPEGVRTTFEYEGNAAGFYVSYYNYSHPVGGLRIARIQESVADPLGGPRRIISEKKYQYGITPKDPEQDQPLLGGGIIKHIVTNLDYCSMQRYSDGSFTTTWGSTPVSNITFNNGSAVLYSFVREDWYAEGNNAVITNKYYYDVVPHLYNGDILRWDNYQSPNRKIATNFYDLQASQRNNPYARIIRKKMLEGFNTYSLFPNYLSELLLFNRPYDIYERESTADHPDSDYAQGQLIRSEQYRGGDTLVSATVYEYTIKNCWYIGKVSVDKPYRTLVYKNAGDPNYTENKKVYDEFASAADSGWDIETERWKALTGDITRQYFYVNGSRQMVESTKKYEYITYNMNPASTITTLPGESITDEYTYHGVLVNIPATHQHTVNNDTETSIVDFLSNNRPNKVRYKTGKMSIFDTKLTYHEYDAYGNIAELSTIDGKHICYIWSYNNQYPVVEIDNISYSQLLTALGKDRAWIKTFGNKTQPLTEDWALLDGLRTVFKNTSPAVLVRTFSYKPLLGLSSITDPLGVTTYYVLDNFGRLTQAYQVENGVKKVLQQHQYHLHP